MVLLLVSCSAPGPPGCRSVLPCVLHHDEYSKKISLGYSMTYHKLDHFTSIREFFNLVLNGKAERWSEFRPDDPVRCPKTQHGSAHSRNDVPWNKGRQGGVSDEGRDYDKGKGYQPEERSRWPRV